MSVNPDIHDKAYQFFIEEAAELLQIIEDGILELRRDRGANTVHAVMRAAHSIKGGAASVELEAIKTIAHRMETAFRALYDETVEIDDELEGLLLDGFDCLKDPLNEQIETGSHDPEAALATAMPIIEELEAKLGEDALKQADSFIPSSSDLGIDMVTSIFEMDVEEGIVHLEEVAANPGNYPVLGELQAQAEVFVGFGELLELPGFGTLAQAILDACHNNPSDPVGLLAIALQDLHAAKELVMGGERDQGGAPSEALLALAGGGTASAASAPEANSISTGDLSDFGLSEADLANFDLGSADLANGDLSALVENQAQPDNAAPETVRLEDGLTDAGLGDLDLAALTMEGDALLETAEASEVQPEAAVNGGGADVDFGADFGADDFQALIDESSDLDLSDDEEDEFATVDQAATDLISTDLGDPIVDELEVSQTDGPALNSMDAMAQLADLMAEPDLSGSAAVEAETADEDNVFIDKVFEEDFLEENAFEENVFEPDSLEESELSSEPAVVTASNAEAALEPNSVNSHVAESETALGTDDVLGTADIAGTDSASEPQEIDAPDAELENMWAGLDDDFGGGPDAGLEQSAESDLDSAFDIALDDASAAADVAMQSQANSGATAQIDDDLADVFAEEEIVSQVEQDNTTALSVAEADAAFAALVDASEANGNDGVLDAEINLDFDDDLEISTSAPTAENNNLEDILALENDATEEGFVAEPSIDDSLIAEPANELTEPANERADAQPVLEEEAQAQDFVAEASGEIAAMPFAEQFDQADTSNDTPSPAENEGELLDPWASLIPADNPGSEIAAEEAEQEQPVASREEFVDEGTFVQGLEMGTFVQTSEALSSTPGMFSESEATSLESPALEALTEAAASDERSKLDRELADATESVTENFASESFDEGTFIQGADDGTLVQTLEQIQAATAQTGDLENVDVETAETDSRPSSQSSDDASESTEVNRSESFDEGTFIQPIDDSTFIQVIPAEPSAPAPEDLGKSEESFDEGTFVQGIDDGTFVQGVTDAVEPQAIAEAEDAWDSNQSESDNEETAEEEPLIPELQAFIAQAAAESAGSVDSSTAEKVELMAATDAPESPESDGSEAEANEPDLAEAAVDESEAATPEIAEPMTSEVESAEAAQPATVTPSSSAAELPEQQGQPELDLAETEAQSIAEEAPQDNSITEASAQAQPNAELDDLPSLETMFAVEPEQLAAIASDSLAPELIDAPELETIKSIQSNDPSPSESSPEANQPSPDQLSEQSSDEPQATAEAKALDPNPAGPPASKAPLTDAAVEVALAEHQAAEPTVTIDGNPQGMGDGTSNESQAKQSSINDAVLAVEQMFGQLPTNNQLPAVPQLKDKTASPAEAKKKDQKDEKKKRQQGTKLSGISVRVDLSVLERMNNLVGELVLSRNSLSLQHEQLQSVVGQLDKRFNNFENQLNGLRGISDQMLVEPAQRQASAPALGQADAGNSEEESLLAGFDVLEMDRYSALHGQLQEIFEQLMQLEEGVDDISVLLEQSTQSLTQQRQRLGLLQNELMWARMLPLDNILGRFPRVLRDMARKHKKSVDLNMNGTSVLVDKGMLEKLHDPMLHLLRNAFDHGIEKPAERKQQGKPERGEIQINAYYQGNQTVIEIKDDGQGVNLDRIAKRAVELEWLSREEVKSIPQQTLLDLIFEPGFTTAAKLSDLSGRGVGLDVVREQLKSLKGNVTVDFEKGKGTTFTLRLPLTLTVAKLMVCQVGSTAIALPSDGIEDLLVPQPEQLKMVGNKRLLHWRDDLIPIQSMAELLDYSCPTADISNLKAITSNSIPVPQEWELPLLIFSRGSQRCAMEVNRLLMEQELVIKPFSTAITPPAYSYGCTILGDGRMIPVLDGTALLQQLSDNSMAMAAGVELSDDDLEEGTNDGDEPVATMAQAMQADTILIVDDSTAMRRTMALSLEKAGYRVLQASDGQEALTQLRQSNAIQLVICDVEMPNMNGFEFLSQRRREPMLMKVPVVMLTSRSSDKHRRLAMQLKAHDYFSKPYVEQDFLKSIKQILTSQAASAKV